MVYNKLQMRDTCLKKSMGPVFTILILAFFFAGSSAYASSNLSSSDGELIAGELTELKARARNYRQLGFQEQGRGDLEKAMAWYQKAAELDPSYAVAYNDLGIVYEAKGFTDRAEESYLRSVRLDPAYLSAYTNLALLYEGRRDLEKAAAYWNQRARLGSPGDPWTEKARARLRDIKLVASATPLEDEKEKEILALTNQVRNRKCVLKSDKKELARDYLEKAKLKYKKGKGVLALKMAANAAAIDPSNTEIKEFIEKVQNSLLSQ